MSESWSERLEYGQ